MTPPRARHWWETGTCPAVLEACLCDKIEGHSGAHACSCGGSWMDDETIIALPGGSMNPLIAEARLLGIRDDDDE